MLVDFLHGAEALDGSTDDLRRFVAHLLGQRSPYRCRPLSATAAVLRLGRS